MSRKGLRGGLLVSLGIALFAACGLEEETDLRTPESFFKPVTVVASYASASKQVKFTVDADDGFLSVWPVFIPQCDFFSLEKLESGKWIKVRGNQCTQLDMPQYLERYDEDGLSGSISSVSAAGTYRVKVKWKYGYCYDSATGHDRPYAECTAALGDGKAKERYAYSATFVIPG